MLVVSAPILMKLHPFRHGLLMTAFLAVSAKDAARTNRMPPSVPAASPVSASPAAAAPTPQPSSPAKVRNAEPSRMPAHAVSPRMRPKFVPRPLQSGFGGTAAEKGPIRWERPSEPRVLTGCVVGQPCACNLSAGTCVSGPPAKRYLRAGVRP